MEKKRIRYINSEVPYFFRTFKAIRAISNETEQKKLED